MVQRVQQECAGGLAGDGARWLQSRAQAVLPEGTREQRTDSEVPVEA